MKKTTYSSLNRMQILLEFIEFIVKGYIEEYKLASLKNMNMRIYSPTK